MTREAFDVSERFTVPVMVRLVTRIAHSRSGVELAERRPVNPLAPTRDSMHWTLLPSNARKAYADLVAKQTDLLAWSESSRWNQLYLHPTGGRRGVIASGIGLNYFLENCPDGRPLPPYLKIGAYPIPKALVERLLEQVDSVIVLEDGYPFIESALRGLLGAPNGKRVQGKLDGTLPRMGELTPDIVRAALGMPAIERQKAPKLPMAERPPRLCDGCPHIDSYTILRMVMDAFPETRVFSDIGCYTLGAYPPYEAAHSCIDMGASISMAMGAAQAGMHPVLATIGDSTFMHSGMTPLAGAVEQNLPMTVVILDNSTTAMTGGQPSMASDGRLLQVVKGLGVNPEHIHVLEAHRKHQAANLEIIKREVAYEGLSVIIPTRECVVTAVKK